MKNQEVIPNKAPFQTILVLTQINFILIIRNSTIVSIPILYKKVLETINVVASI